MAPGNVTQSQTAVQQSYPACTVTVYLPGTTTKTTIYSDNSGTVSANPFTASVKGFYLFYADDGVVDVQLSGSGFTSPYTLGSVQVGPYVDANGVAHGGLQVARNGAYYSTALKRDPNDIAGDRLSVKSFSPAAKGDGSTDDTAAIQNAFNSATNQTILIPQGVYKVCGLTVTKFGKIEMTGAVLVPTAGCTQPILSVTTQVTLQDTDQRILKGIRIDCQSSATVPGGLYVGGFTAEFTTYDVQVSNCVAGYGIKYYGTQFSENYNTGAFNNLVGIEMISDVTAGGGNSNDFYGPELTNNQVGYFQYSPAYNQGTNYFYNTNFLSNFVCATAIIGPAHASVTETRTNFYWYGGSPEGNAQNSAPNSVVIEGITIPKTMMYLSYAEANLDRVAFSDAQAHPEIMATNNSIVRINDSGGYSQPSLFLVDTDSTSQSFIGGMDRTIGYKENVGSYPSNILGPSQSAFWGAPAFVASSGVPNFYTGNPMQPAMTPTGAISVQTLTDPLFGPTSTVTYAASVGTPGTNKVSLGTVTPAPPASTLVDILISVLVKPDRDCLYSIQDATNQFVVSPIQLYANRWTRVVAINTKVAGAITLIGFPLDTTGPTVAWTGIETLTAPLGQMNVIAPVQEIMTTGAVNPNGFVVSAKAMNFNSPNGITFQQSPSAPTYTSTATTGTLPLAITSTTPVPNLHTSPIMYTPAGTQLLRFHGVTFFGALTAGTATVALSGAAVFTNAGSYYCSGSTSNSSAAAINVSNNSGTQFTVYGSGTNNFSVVCWGQ
jgi:hypothetical protein